MRDRYTRAVFVHMLREEWRLHDRVMQGRHFGVFPVLLALLIAGAMAGLEYIETDLGLIFAGLHALAFVFGLHTGSIGLVGRDALQRLIGDLTLLVFSSRTLPVRQRRLLGVFVVKDLVYYAMLFLLPIAIGVLPVLPGSGYGISTPALLWLTLTGMFVLGMGMMIVLLGCANRGMWGRGLLVTGGAAVAFLWTSNVSVLAYTPYGLFLDPSLVRLVTVAGVVGAVVLLGIVTFDVHPRETTRFVQPLFRRLHRHLRQPVATRTVVTLHRSSGGLGKVVVSAAVLFVATAGLVELTEHITGVSPSAGISFGAILGLTAFTTYNWITQLDERGGYTYHPVRMADIYRGKRRVFLVLGPAVGLLCFGIAVIWHRGPILEGVIGAILLLGVSNYIFGVTVYLAGLAPNEFLFDTRRFAVFGAAIAIPLVPILVAAFVGSPIATGVLGVLGVSAVALGGAGELVYRQGVRKWTR